MRITFPHASQVLALAFALAAGPVRAQSPAFNHAVSFNPTAATGDSYGNAVALDAAGNQYITGEFSGTLVLGTTTLTSAGLGDIFVAKRSASTGAWLWAVRAGGLGGGQGFGVVVDAAGDAVVTGYFEGTASFGTGPSATNLTSAGRRDLFVAKFGASTGAAIWAVRAGGSDDDGGSGVALDAAGNALVTGQFSSTAIFGTGPTAPMLTSAGGTDVFVAKLGASTGAVAWAVAAGGSGYDYSGTVAVDAAGNALVTGSFGDTARFGSGFTAPSLTSAGPSDVFVAKFGASTGAAAWAVRAGGSGTDRGSAVAVDAAGNTLVTGSFSGTANFGTSPTATSLTSAGPSDIFVAKFGASTGAAVWAVRAGGSPGAGSSAVAVDATGNALVTGYFFSTANFGTSPTPTSLTSAGGPDVFVAKFGAGTGAAAWAVRAGGSDYDFGNGVAVDALGNALVTGRFDNAASFGSQNLVGSTSGNTGFLAVLGNAGTLAAAGPASLATLTCYPNPAHGAARLAGAAPHAPLALRDALGRTMRTGTADASGAAPLDLRGLPAGLYLLQAGTATRRLTVE